jgi:hypothetical protein
MPREERRAFGVRCSLRSKLHDEVLATSRPPQVSDRRREWQADDSASRGRAVFDNVGSNDTGVGGPQGPNIV